MYNSNLPGRVLLGICWVITMVAGIIAAHHHDQMLKKRKIRLTECRVVCTDLRVYRDRLSSHLAGLEDDPSVIEEAIRRKLRWTKSGEVVLGYRESKADDLSVAVEPGSN